MWVPRAAWRGALTPAALVEHKLMHKVMRTKNSSTRVTSCFPPLISILVAGALVSQFTPGKAARPSLVSVRV
jgi:hypothetical protein